MLEDETGKIGSLMCESLSQRIIPIVLELSVYSKFFDGNGFFSSRDMTNLDILFGHSSVVKCSN